METPPCLPLSDLELLLNTPPRIIFTHRETFTGHDTQNVVVPTHRYIRIVKGELVYTVDDHNAGLQAGTVLFVPKGARRFWHVARGEICEIVWCEFETPGFAPNPHTFYLTADCRAALEKAALLRMARAWNFPGYLRGTTQSDPALPRPIRLLLEGELKASLARFWSTARAWNPECRPRERTAGGVHSLVRHGLAWMEENFRMPDADIQLFAHLPETSPRYFRRLFISCVGCSVAEHLMNLRMREAMRLLRSSTLSMKQIASGVGFSDALYFSRRFRRHWDIAPSEVRK
jgi:AraC-like DNA-binding protein